jgi:hypothetical protein
VSSKTSKWSLEARGKFREALQIAAVTLEGVIGETPFDSQMGQIRVDEIVCG